MNDYARLEALAKEHKKEYPPGTRVYLKHMNDPYHPVPAGTRGTVDHVDDLDNIHVTWDNLRTLPLCPDVDSFRKLTTAERNAELRRDHQVVSFGDDCEITLPKDPIDCSSLGYFDDLEYDCWHLVEKYCEHFGIRILDCDDEENPISFDVAKSVQEVILERLQESGVQFQFDRQTEDAGMQMGGM